MSWSLVSHCVSEAAEDNGVVHTIFFTQKANPTANCKARANIGLVLRREVVATEGRGLRQEVTHINLEVLEVVTQVSSDSRSTLFLM